MGIWKKISSKKRLYINSKMTNKYKGKKMKNKYKKVIEIVKLMNSVINMFHVIKYVFDLFFS